MLLQNLTIISRYAFNSQNSLDGPEVKGKLLTLIAKFFLLCMCSIILVGYNEGFTNINTIDTYSNIELTKTSSTQTVDSLSSVPMSSQLWHYLRTGLNYLESSGRNYPPSFVHPGGVAYGSLGLTRIAVIDVIQNYASLSKFTPEDAFIHFATYEEFAKNYADLLLRHYLGMDYHSMSPEEVFDILQRAWFLGPNLYKEREGRVILSREKKAKEYISKIAKSSHQPLLQQEEIF